MLVSLLGGMLIGLSAALLYLGVGRIAGISGVTFGLLTAGDREWRLVFLLALIAGGWLAIALSAPVPGTSTASPGLLVGSGLLVGFGTRLGNGCTSGHGVCGLSRLSRRSLVAVAVFMATGMIVATALGGVLA